jgi:hypothetical protein
VEVTMAKVKVSELAKILSLLDPSAELDGGASFEGGLLKLHLDVERPMEVLRLYVTNHVNSGDLADHDDIDMNSFESTPGCRKSYYHALSEDEDPVEVFGETVGNLDMDFQGRNSFEFNRDPVSSEEAEAAIAKYVG